MSDEVVSAFQDFMFELTLDAARRRWEPLNKILEREAQEQKAIDDRYLATLSSSALKHELFRRRLESAERRYRNWWEENMAWRFAPHPPESWNEEW